MEEKKQRSYSKESTKTTPSGIRFDKEQLGFIQQRESKLNTKQKVVDFLLNKYWWEQKAELKPNHKGLPPQSSIQDLTKPTNEIKPFEQPKSNFTANTMAKSFEQYRAEKRACELPEQWERLEREIDADPYLTSKQKHLLKTII